MKRKYETDLYKRIKKEIDKIQIIDTHEHLQRENELPHGKEIHIGRFFIHYANCDLISAGMPLEEMERVQDDLTLSPKERWSFLEPWYLKSYNTTYNESIRIALQDLYDIEDFSTETVETLTERMAEKIRPGLTKEIFRKADIEYAMNNPFGPLGIYNSDFERDIFICDMIDNFSELNMIDELAGQSGMEIRTLCDYLKVIDFYFDRDGKSAGGFKVSRAYDRSLLFNNVSQVDVEDTFLSFLNQKSHQDKAEKLNLENFIIHYLCRKCGDYGIRMKFHTGLQEGNGNDIKNSRASLLSNLFLKYPETDFDIYHISYPYQEELTVLAKNFANVTINFCWIWIINPSAGRRALSDMLDTVPANKIHGFGGDYIFVEGTYAHSVIARREITRVLCEKIEEGRFNEEYAVQVGQMLLRDNAIENFGLKERRKALKGRV